MKRSCIYTIISKLPIAKALRNLRNLAKQKTLNCENLYLRNIAKLVLAKLAKHDLRNLAKHSETPIAKIAKVRFRKYAFAKILQFRNLSQM